MKMLTAIGAFSVVAVLAAAPAFAQNAKAAEPKVEGLKRTPEGKIDFTGTFEWPKYLPGAKRGRSSATTFDAAVFPPLKEGGEPFIEPRTGDPRHDEPRDYCMPAGFPAGMLSGNAMQFFQTKDYLVIVHEFQRMTRIIPLDGRPHRTYVEPSYYGDPVGHWEGDTLVIVTKNFKRWMIDDYFYTSPKEYRMHSDALVSTERIRFKDKNTISYVLTMEDPKIFTKPYTQEFEIKARPEWEKDGLIEYICEENNRCPGGKCQGN
ncbi:MAG: hypothetical protein ABL967_13345 [Bryobacteraceae bacterium]